MASPDPTAIADLFRFFEKTRARGLPLTELRERVLRAITPAIENQDAHSLAGVHDLVVRYFDALEGQRGLRPQDSPQQHKRAGDNVAHLEAALRYVLGIGIGIGAGNA